MIVRSFFSGYRGLFALLLSLLPGWLGAATQVATDNTQIRAAVDQFLTGHSNALAQQYGEGTRIDYSILQLDSRLALAPCPAPLATELSGQNRIGRVNIKVSCPEENRWSLYVPADIGLFRPVVVNSSPIAKGSALQRDQLRLREMNISQISGEYFTRYDDVVGLVARRPLNPDEPVLAQQLEPPVVVRRGESVFMTAKSGTLLVRMPGVALTDGREGEQIPVRNQRSQRVVDARVTGPGQVEVLM